MIPLPIPHPAAPFNYWALSQQCAAIIAQHGQPAILRRGGQLNAQDRWVRVFLRRWNAREMMGGLADPLVRMALLAPINPPPDHDLDRLITFLQPLGDVPVEDENLRIIVRPEPIKPAGTLVFWKLSLRR
jgi:hypothetical protein